MPELHDPVPTREKVLIIGAGPSGLAAAAALKALEVPFDLVDRSRHVGGIWDSDRDDSPVWPAMEMVSSTAFTQFEELLQPVSFPDFLAPGQMGKYLRAYAAHHDLTDHFHPRTGVRRAWSFGEGVWQVEFSNGVIDVYRAVISAHGIAERPHSPEWARELGEDLTVLHAKDWTGADGLDGKRVLVVGSGQSAADIAVDASRRALEVRLSMRTGHWVLPRRIASVPGDVAASKEPALPGRLNAKIAQTVVSRVAGDPAKAGLPRPATGVLEDDAIISDELLDRVEEGRITPIGDVAGVEDGLPVFADSTRFVPDVVVLATGYESGADHLPEDVVPRTDDGALDLFLGAFPRDRDDLVVLGQQRVTGGVLPVLVQQADIAAFFLRAVAGSTMEAARFRALRTGDDSAVPTGVTSRSGLLGRLEDALGGSTPRSRAARNVTRERGLIPSADRDELLARLETVRGLFE